MRLTKKFFGVTAIGALAITFVIRLVTVFSIQDIYTCSAANCDALSSANTKIGIGVTLQYISLAIFVVASLAFLYLWATKKERF